MNRIAVAIAWGIAVSPATGGERSLDPPLRVYVTAGRPADAEDGTDAPKAKKERAHEARLALERRLKETYGKKRASWPPAAEGALGSLEEAEALADATYEYRRADPRGLSDSAREISDAFAGHRLAGRRERVEVAASATEADLVVEVTARRSGKTMPTQVKPDRCYMLFTVAPGARMDPERFTKVPADYRLRKLGLYAWTIAGPRTGRPVFYFESYNGGGKEFGCQGAAASAASAAVDKFIEDNYRFLTR
jgi:hypothetical protein